MAILAGIRVFQELICPGVFTYSLFQKLQLKLRWIRIGTLVFACSLTVQSSRILFLIGVALLILC